MEHGEESNVLSLKDLWSIFTYRILWIVIAGVLGFVLTLVYSNYTYKEQYRSTLDIYILNKESDSNPGGVSSTDFSIALSTVNDCRQMLTCDYVLERVIRDLGMDMSIGELRGMISVTNAASSRILSVSVTVPSSAQEAQTIIQRLCEVGDEFIMETIKFDQINPLGRDDQGNYLGSYNENPINSKFTYMTVVAGLLAAIGVFGVFVVIFLFDDKINTPEDVEKYIGLTVLGMIPNIDDGKDDKGNRRYYGRKSEKYGAGN